MKSIFAVFDAVALINYVPDQKFDLATHTLTETRDAVIVTWNAGERIVNRIIYSL